MDLGLDAWWDEPDYKQARGTLFQRGAFILRKLRQHDEAKLQMVMDDLYRECDWPEVWEITRFEWEVILSFLGRMPRRSRTCRSGWAGYGGDGGSTGWWPRAPGYCRGATERGWRVEGELVSPRTPYPLGRMRLVRPPPTRIWNSAVFGPSSFFRLTT
jgi:hypothetical protein